MSVGSTELFNSNAFYVTTFRTDNGLAQSSSTYYQLQVDNTDPGAVTIQIQDQGGT